MKRKVIAHKNDLLYNDIMKCECLKNESNYFVTCKNIRLILQPLQDQPKVLKSSNIIRLIL